MIRRHSIYFNDDHNYVQTTRRRATFRGASNFDHVLGYRKPEHVDRFNPLYKWIGRRFYEVGRLSSAYWDILPYDNFIAEEYITRQLYPHTFRIIYVKKNKETQNYDIRSVAEVTFVPTRANLFIDADTEVIVGIAYF